MLVPCAGGARAKSISGRKSRSRRSRKRSCKRTRKVAQPPPRTAADPEFEEALGGWRAERSLVFTRGFYFRPQSRNPEAGAPAIEDEREVITTAKECSRARATPQR